MAVWRLPCLHPDGHLNGLVHVGNPHQRQDGHHELHLHEGVVLLGLHEDHFHVIAHGNADLVQDVLGALAHKLGLGALALLGHQLHQLADHGGVLDLVSTVLLHVEDQVVGHGVHGDDFLLGDAGQVVVKGAAVHDILGGLLDVGGLVHHDGGAGRRRRGLLAAVSAF